MKRRSHLKILFVVIVCVLVDLGTISQAQTPSFQGIGGSNEYYTTRATEVSDDGLVVAGFTIGLYTGGNYAFRWTEWDGIQYLGRLPDSFFGDSAPEDISADGTVIVGHALAGLYSWCAFYWTPLTGMAVLDPMLGSPSRACAVSADGLVVAGAAQWWGSQAFVWTPETGAVGLGSLSGGDSYSWTYPYGISSDGSVIVGESDNPQSQQEAFRWTAGTGMVGLGDLPGGAFSSVANAVSSDGSVVVGHSEGAAGSEALLWKQATGMVGLGFLPGGAYTEALGVSGDGSVVVGTGGDALRTQVAVIWDPVYGMRSLRDVLVNEFGLNLTGWTLVRANDVTPDGHTIVGDGINPDGGSEGWIAVIPDLVRRISAVVDFDPDVLKLRSAVPQITCYIRLPAGDSVANIDRNTVLLNGQVRAASVQIDTKKQVATAKFDRSAMSGILVPGVVCLTATGKLPDRTVFKGIGTITVRE